MKFLFSILCFFSFFAVALVNSQVLLKGIETRGYVILSAAKAEILQRVHQPVWKERTLVSKTTWVGSLECMQYYATVSANIDENIDDNIMWLTLDNIQVSHPGIKVKKINRVCVFTFCEIVFDKY
mgnify:CR=1 FL=1